MKEGWYGWIKDSGIVNGLGIVNAFARLLVLLF
jgi:hypothetical protein